MADSNTQPQPVVMRELLHIAEDMLPEGDDYSDGVRCDECGTARVSTDQTLCDVPGCFYVRIREGVAKAKTLLGE